MSNLTLGDAWRLGWRARVRCLLLVPKPKSREATRVECDTSTELDMKTLVWTRGEKMPLERIASLFRCPRCGSRKIHVVFDVPNQPNIKAAVLFAPKAKQLPQSSNIVAFLNPKFASARREVQQRFKCQEIGRRHRLG
jgi:hypothetical protein